MGEPEEDTAAAERDGWRTADPILRTTAVVAVGASAVAWWPAFTLGTYGQVFFEQTLTLWAVSTAAFLVLVIFGRRRAVSWPHRLALLLPTLWLVTAFVLPTGTEAGENAVLFWLAVGLSVIGGPFLAWVLLRIGLVGYDTLTRRHRLAAVVVVVAVVLVAYTLGRLNAYFLTCDDFTVSGNSAPPGCTHGPSTIN